MRIVSIVVLALAVPSYSFASECESLIGLSKIVSSTTSDKSSLEQHAASFCKEYNQYHSDSKQHDFGASYKFLSASYGSSGATVDEVASKYCSARTDNGARSDAFRQYIESIAPGAYDAYESCVKNSANDLVFSINEASILPGEFMLTASFKSGMANVNSADLDVSSSSGVTCTWNNTNSSNKTVPTGGSAILKCMRQDISTKSSVTVIGTTIANAPPVVIPWKAYDKDGNDKDVIRSLSDQIRTLNSAFKNAVVAFNADKCPDGWTDYKQAYGRVVRGIDNSGKNIDPDGQRLPGSLQEDSFKSHAHTYNDMFFSEVGGQYDVTNALGSRSSDNDNKGWGIDRTTQAAGGHETRSKNVALLYCVRQ